MRKKIILLMLLTAPLFLFANNNFEQSVGSLKVVVTGFNSNEGMARAGVYFNAEGRRINQQLSAHYNLATAIRQQKAIFEINNLQPGRYAVSVMHDSNNNCKMDYGWMNLPEEQYGFSNHPKILVSPPLFDECSIPVSAGQQALVNIHLK